MATNDVPALITDEFYEKMAAEAAAIASIEVVPWAPLEFGDHVCGRVIDTGTIELPSLRNPGDIDVWPTNTVVPIGTVRLDGKDIDVTGKVVRVAWLGPVQLGHYQRTTPANDDVVAMHYQSDQTPKSGLNDYKLVNCIVFDHDTGAVKHPQSVEFGARSELGAGVATGNLEGKVKFVKPLDPRPGEEPL